MTETILQDALYTSSNAVHYPLNGSYMPSAMWTLLLHLRVDVFPESTAEVKSGLPSTHAWIWCITTGPSTLLCYCGYSVIAYYVWLHLTGIFFYRNYSRRGQDLWRRNCGSCQGMFFTGQMPSAAQPTASKHRGSVSAHDVMQVSYL